MPETKTVRCPRCGSKFSVHESHDTASCPDCGTRFLVVWPIAIDARWHGPADKISEDEIATILDSEWREVFRSFCNSKRKARSNHEQLSIRNV